MSTSKKKAMVQPKPKPPEFKQTSMQGADERLAFVLEKLGNDRAYTILDTDLDSWLVWFEGTSQASTIKQVKGKWVIV